MLNHNRVPNSFFAKNWLKNGWNLYKRAPITWTFMILVFCIAYLVAMNSLPGKAFAALFTPVFLGALYVAAFTADNGKSISMENLFSMFKDHQKLKQLLTIGCIGVAVVGLTYLVHNMAGSDYAMSTEFGGDLSYTDTTFGETLSDALFLIWVLATIFSIPLVSITNQGAIESIKNSIVAALANAIPLFIFFTCAVLLTILGAIPFGLGLLVVVPTLFCASYFVFKTLYLDGIDNRETAALERTDNTAVQSSSSTTDDAMLDSAKRKIQKSSLDFSESLSGKMQQAQDPHAPLAKTQPSPPKGLTIHDVDGTLQITRKWAGISSIALFIGTAIFNVVWINGGFVEILSGDRNLLLKLFCLTYIVLGAASLYFAIAHALNKTQVYISKNAITIQHHPIPWPGNKTIETKTIKQILVNNVASKNNGRTTTQYHVTSLTLDDCKIKLLSGLSDYRQAHFIERKIEDYLGIENEIVADDPD